MGSKFRFCNLQVIWTYFIRSVISYPRTYLYRAQNALFMAVYKQMKSRYYNSCDVVKSGCDKSKGILIYFSEFRHFSENKQVILDQIWLWQINSVYVFLLKQIFVTRLHCFMLSANVAFCFASSKELLLVKNESVQCRSPQWMCQLLMIFFAKV